MSIETDRIQLVQGSTAYLNGIIRSRLVAYDTDKGRLVYSPDGLTWVDTSVSSDGSILLDGNGKIILSYLPDSILATHYIHHQLAASTTWDITNPFGRPVNITFTDSAGNPFICNWQYMDGYARILASSTWAISGEAVLT